MKTLRVLLLPLLCVLGACSTQQLYGAGQAWQRTECTRMPDPDQRQRCFASTATSYDEYKRQTQPAK